MTEMIRQIKSLVAATKVVLGRSGIVIFLLALIASGLVVSQSPPASADAANLQTTPQLTLQSANGRWNYGVNETFTINVVANDVQDLAAVEYDLVVDPDILEIIDATRGSCLQSTGRQGFDVGQQGYLNPIVNNTTGSLAYGDYTYSDSGTAGYNGSCVVTAIQLKAKQATTGNSTLDLQNPIAVNTQANTLGVTPVDQTFTVSTFGDVPSGHWAENFILPFYQAGITSGCGPGVYCPDNNVTRAQMAVFMMRGIHGSAYTPPPATGAVFADVGVSSFAADWIEAFLAEGITSGCGGGNYCPGDNVTRAQMAVFMMRAIHGSAYTPPPATGAVFADVGVSSFAADWIEAFLAEGITSGCGGGNFCPNDAVTRAQMAVFMVRAFNIPTN